MSYKRMTKDEQREKSIVRDMGECANMRQVQLFKGGGGHDDCNAGVPFKAMGGQPFRLANLPCHLGNSLDDAEMLERCPKWVRTTREQAEKSFDESEAYFAKVVSVRHAIAPWRKKPPIGKQEVIECPACKGRLHLSQAAVNGHVHAKCETAGCVSWME